MIHRARGGNPNANSASMMMFNKGLKTLESRYKNIYFQSETKANYIISQSMIMFFCGT